MRGRKPIPTSILRLRGSPKAKRRGDEPQAHQPTTPPDPPDWLDDIARDKWAELQPMLAKMGTLLEPDYDHLRSYCVAFSRWVKAEQRLKAEGEVVQFANGVTGRNHWLAVATGALERMDKDAQELGLSAVSRARLHVDPNPAPAVDSRRRYFTES